MKLSAIIFILFIAEFIKAQEPSGITLTNNTLSGFAGQMPFWFHANQNGKVADDAAFINLFEARINVTGYLAEKNRLKYFAGSNLIAGLSEKSYCRANQLFAGMEYKKWRIKAGWFQNPVQYEGLSSTNGDIHWSNNIRPMPRVQLSTDYLQLSFFPSWLSVRGLYEEAWLDDETRYVQEARLHHKNVFFRFNISAKSSFVVGLDHYSQWGGVHPTRGQLPAGFNDYVRYVLGLPGSEEFSLADQHLMAGNQLGKYVLKFNRQFQNNTLEIYLNHPFTDRMDWSNYKDNLLGVFLKSGKDRFVTHILYEFMYTKYQRAVLIDGEYTVPGGGSEPYFRHYIYRSGLSYQNRMFVTPFAIPMVIADGVNYGTGNNRIVLHHIGIAGNITNLLKWKTLLSFSKNFGTYKNVYDKIQPGFFDSSRNQFSMYAGISYHFTTTPWMVHLAFAADEGSLLKNNRGMQLKVSYHFF